MPVEAELKARVRDVVAVRTALTMRAERRRAVYHDTYFDAPERRFMADGHELRLRSVETADSVRHLLTFKAPAVDEASGSKPEQETAVADRDATHEILLGLGYSVAIEFTKNCENFEFSDNAYDMLATLVTVPELDGTFLEVETIVPSAAEIAAALDAVRRVLTMLGITEDDLTTELYTDAVVQAQAAPRI
ncbi:class IV adenylate cyclase [Catenulispora yoronensis]|uniref:Class IV adenylate cyclase n=1 Tax=Catenulispora yoronensis TaxID=450799 RepID=A0ABP5FPE0_9ACTN